jgi:activator of HSP90 ATPase
LAGFNADIVLRDYMTEGNCAESYKLTSAKVKSSAILSCSWMACAFMKTKTELTFITQKVIIPATPKQVYEAFVDPKKHGEFTGAKAVGIAKVGGKFTAWDGYIFGKFLAFEPGKYIVQEWMTTDWPKDYPPSKFELTFKAVPEGTEITMIHSNIPQQQKQELAEGWAEFYWIPLKRHFKKQPKPAP